jgi:hypothetical protein
MPQETQRSMDTPITTTPVLTDAERRIRKYARESFVQKHGLMVVGSGLEVKTSTIVGAGLGLFTKLPIKKGQWITEYSGTVIERDEADRLKSKKKHSHIRVLEYQGRCMNGFRNPADAIGLGGASFANDARHGPFTNNATFKNCTDNTRRLDGKKKVRSAMPRCVLIAKVDIPANSEIFISYGKDFWASYETKTDSESESETQETYKMKTTRTSKKQTLVKPY